MYNQLILFRCKGPPLHDIPLEQYSFGTAVGTYRCFIGLYGAWQIDSNGVTFVTMCSVDHPTEVHFHMHTTKLVQY